MWQTEITRDPNGSFLCAEFNQKSHLFSGPIGNMSKKWASAGFDRVSALTELWQTASPSPPLAQAAPPIPPTPSATA